MNTEEIDAILTSNNKNEKYRLFVSETTLYTDIVLSLIITVVTPFIWMFSQVHDKIMYQFLDSYYIYNVSWEDPRMDQRVFNLGEKDHILTIASAGCNVLDYIIEGAEVTAVDFNSCQIALTELKAVAIQNIEYDDFFDIFGRSNMGRFRELYPTHLRPHLTKPSADFWDSHKDSIHSFMYSGTSGTLSYVLFRILFPLLGLGFIRDNIIKEVHMDRMRKEIMNNSYMVKTLVWCADNLLLRGGSCMAGVPERQLELGVHRRDNMLQVFNRIFLNTDLVNDNYFFAGYILGYYQKNNCPRYLRKENYEKMRETLNANKLHLLHGSILDGIKQTKKPFTVASLLDHMDWMSERDINNELVALSGALDKTKGLIYWRSFADDVHAPPLQWLTPTRVCDDDDRVGMYWTTWIADFNNCLVKYEPRVDTSVSKGFLVDLVTGMKMVSFPIWAPFIKSYNYLFHGKSKNDINSDIELFYKYQQDGYDSFREGLLHGRSILMECLPLKKSEKMIWMDVGGGTARNLEYFTPEVLRSCFKTIYIVDISDSLLEVAKERVKKMGIADIVQVINMDITSDSIFKYSLIPDKETVDIVTMSYSFSMIPNKKDALDNIKRLLRRNGGILAIADFVENSKHEDMLPKTVKLWRYFEKAFQIFWFSMDNVKLLSNKELNEDVYNSNVSMHTPDGFEMEILSDTRIKGGVPYLSWFLPLTPYHSVAIALKH